MPGRSDVGIIPFPFMTQANNQAKKEAKNSGT